MGRNRIDLEWEAMKADVKRAVRSATKDVFAGKLTVEEIEQKYSFYLEIFAEIEKINETWDAECEKKKNSTLRLVSKP